MSPSLPTKKTSDIAVACGFHNFANFSAPKRNLLRFIRYIHSLGVKCYGVELVLDGHESITHQFPTWKQIPVTENHILWHKETLWNLAEKLVPPSINKIVCCDTDIAFTSSKWLRRLSDALDENRVIQPFRFMFKTDKNGVITRQMGSVGYTQKLGPDEAHPGYAMAFRRSLWKSGPGIFDEAIGGNGDRFLAHAALSDDPVKTVVLQDANSKHPVVPPFVLESYAIWAEHFLAWRAGQKLSHSPVDVIHEYHGELGGRQYKTRREMLLGMTPKELARDSDGLWHWTKEANPLRVQCFKNYFHNRREDG